LISRALKGDVGLKRSTEKEYPFYGRRVHSKSLYSFKMVKNLNSKYLMNETA